MAKLRASLADIPEDTIIQWMQLSEDTGLIDSDYHKEIQGMVDAIDHPEVTKRDLVLWNLIYDMDFPVFCSGIIAAQIDGTVIHGRNMDFDFQWDDEHGITHGLTQITYEAKFVKNGELIMSAIQWPGHVGINTAVSPGGFTFEQNTRSPNGMMNNLHAAQAGGLSFGAFARRIMEETKDFDVAVGRFQAAKFNAPSYFVLSGSKPFQGAVIARGRVEPTFGGVGFDDTEKLTPSDNWFLAQTNSDIWVPSRNSHTRRALGTQEMRVLGREHVSMDTIYHTMHSSPLMVPATIFTFVANAKTGEHQTTLQYNPNPMRVRILSAEIIPRWGSHEKEQESRNLFIAEQSRIRQSLESAAKDGKQQPKTNLRKPRKKESVAKSIVKIQT